MHNSQKFERVLLPNPPFNAPFAFVYQAYPLSQIGESIFVMAVKKLNFKWRSLFYMYFFSIYEHYFLTLLQLKKKGYESCLIMSFSGIMDQEHEMFFNYNCKRLEIYIKKKWDDPASSKPVVAHVWITRVRPFF